MASKNNPVTDWLDKHPANTDQSERDTGNPETEQVEPVSASPVENGTGDNTEQEADASYHRSNEAPESPRIPTFTLDSNGVMQPGNGKIRQDRRRNAGDEQNQDG